MRFTKNSFHLISLFVLSFIVVFTDHCYGARESDPLDELIRYKWRVGSTLKFDTFAAEGYSSTTPVYVGPHQDGLKEADKISILPGQPKVKFDQYSGYVTVDPKAGRALFYYFVEASEEPSSKPLVLWLNGGPGCSSFGNGAMMELGPFRVNKDGQSLYENEYAWNKVANVIFLESPAGVGFSYSNTTSDYEKSGDIRTAQDSYTFLVNWLERFPQYKTRNFYIAGESYAGHYVPQLAQTILQRNKFSNQTLAINLRGIAIGNAWIDDETGLKGMYDYFWTHALISDKTIAGIHKHCNFSSMIGNPVACEKYISDAEVSMGNINIYNIYAPSCILSSKKHLEVFDPCTRIYVYEYLNLPQVQKALHANVTALSYPWSSCSDIVGGSIWNDSPETILPTIQELMASGIGVWIYSGDIDGRVPVTSSQYAIDKLITSVETPWYPWYSDSEVGGYVEGYKNLTFVTIREAGHFVPSYQPARALSFFSYFLEGKLPPTSSW